MNILLLGSGGRECAFAWKISQSPKLSNLWIAPGNAGTSQYGTNVELDINNLLLIKEFAIAHSIRMIVVGPEEPLVNGIKDFFTADPDCKHIGIVGPPANGAILEGSKDFAKEFMKRHNIPTAKFNTFEADTIQDGFQFLDQLNPPYVLKADGLAAGKGVIITSDIEVAKKTLFEILIHSTFGKAGNKVLIEEFLKGIELSVFIATDGINYKILPEAKDYKRIGENDQGPNTGGMGSISPVPFADNSFMQKIEKQIIIPTVEGLKKEKIDYTGFIFFGLIKVEDEPFVIEYNARMGDPESETVIPRIKSDIIDLFEGIVNKNIQEKKIVFDERHAACIMLVSAGYPGSYEKGKIINGLNAVNDSILFHAGTMFKTNEAQTVITNGGRVIAITSLDDNLKQALSKTYTAADKIQFKGKYFRKDIGKDLMQQ